MTKSNHIWTDMLSIFLTLGGSKKNTSRSCYEVRGRLVNLISFSPGAGRHFRNVVTVDLEKEIDLRQLFKLRDPKKNNC